jgi:hypothetical protein
VQRRAPNNRRALGDDPFEAVIPGSEESEREQQSAKVSRPASTRSSRPAPAARVQKTRATFHLPVDLLEETRDVVYWVPGLTMANLTEEALRREIQRIKDVRNAGDDFPSRESDLKRGRPVT